MKTLSKDAKGLIKFIIIFFVILLSGLIARQMNYIVPYYLAVNDYIDSVAGIFLTIGMFMGYAMLQLIMVYVLAMKMLNNTDNKYLKKIFTPFDNSVKILLTLFIFDVIINLIAGHNYDMYNAADTYRGQSLFIYNLYLAPSVKFLVIFLLACLNKLKPAP